MEDLQFTLLFNLPENCLYWNFIYLSSRQNKEMEVHHLKLLKYFMIFTGHWNFRETNSIFIQFYTKFRRIFLVHYLLMTQLMLITIPMVWPCKERVVDLFCLYIQYVNVGIMVMILVKSPKIQKSLDCILSYEELNLKKEDVGTRQLYLKYANLNSRVVILIFTLISSVGAFWYITGIRNTFSIEESVECPLMKGILYQVWYPFDVKKYHWLVFINDLVLLFNALNITVYCKVMIVSMMIFMLSQIKILQFLLTSIGKRSLENPEMDESIEVNVVISFVERHQQILKLIDLLKSAVEEIILIQYFSSTSEIAAYLIQTITSRSAFDVLRNCAALSMLVSEVFILFWFANETKIQSEAISDIIYNELPWYTYKRHVNMVLKLMMRRSQRAMSFKAIFLGEICLDTFTKLMKLCYSVVTCFSSLMDI
ncbi:odorant receptor 10-like [Leptinotarsa decemlineata]|uniref:odorant receptor 10-like n=1 Tax=Leptinotarsa decemlineata TaxID=7539 RepID=UPI003D309846